jgi:putative solute:sodium symporter small subunit
MREPPLNDSLRHHWQTVRRWTALLLLLWAATAFGPVWFARALNFRFFGWPFSYWMAAQGGMLIFLVIVVVYAWLMNRLDLACGLDEDD